MAYQLKIFSADNVSAAERNLAVRRFREALEEVLGDESLVLPCYLAYLKVFHLYGERSHPWPLTPAEQHLVDQWEAAELAATQAAFGINRYLGDADFEIRALP